MVDLYWYFWKDQSHLFIDSVTEGSFFLRTRASFHASIEVCSSFVLSSDNTAFQCEMVMEGDMKHITKAPVV